MPVPFVFLKARAVLPWRWHQPDPPVEPWEDDYFYFHRDELNSDPSCMVCLYREGPGDLVVVNILPEEPAYMNVDQYVRILRDFDARIAEPAADLVGGMTSIDTDKRRLEDYFSTEAIAMLKVFCKTSNVADLGSHPSDQEKWMRFLLRVHRTKNANVDGDTFGACLEAKNWWPEEDIPRGPYLHRGLKLTPSK